jgi:PKHD-type hydroxylase
MIIIDKDLSNEPITFVTSPLVVEEVLTQEEIERIEEITSKLELTIPTYDGEERLDLANYKKAWIPYTDETAWLYGRVYDVVSMYNEEYFRFEPLDMVERIVYNVYEEGAGLDWHIDLASSPPFSTRKLAVTIQLSNSDDYREGFLEFELDERYSMPRTAGTFVIYPSFLWHRVTPVTKGTRKSLTFWVGGTSFK